MSCSNLSWSLEYYEDNIEECNIKLNSNETCDQIPLINSTSFQNFSDGALVRYQGMVQDMLSPEYYSSSFTIINKETNESCVKSGKFRDLTYCKINEELILNEADFMPKERLVYFCVPLPGTNDWVQDTDVRVRVKSETFTESNLNESFVAIRLYLSEEVANKIRRYLTSMRLQNFELEEMVRKIGEDYVSMRQKIDKSQLPGVLNFNTFC